MGPCALRLGREVDGQLAAEARIDRGQASVRADQEVPPGSAPANDSPEIDNACLPALLTVIVSGALSVPCGVLANPGGGAGDTCSTGNDTDTPTGSSRR